MQSKISARLKRENTQDEIYEKIYVAILEHRLHPGTKLVEERLAEIFKVSRARVREVLARLAHEQVVDLYPQRGAYVARPTIEQALHVFEARRLIEPELVRRLIQALARTMRELSTLTCLIIILYDAPTASSCLADEHSLIVDAIAKRDIEGGQRLMLEHLNHIEGSLNLEPADSEVDLAKIFSEK